MADTDGDGVPDNEDAYPKDPSKSTYGVTSVPNVGTGGSKTGSKKKSTLPPGTTATKEKSNSVLWNEGYYGQTLSYKTKSAAISYLTPSVPEYQTVVNAFNSWGAGFYGSKSVNGFWKKIVEDASNQGKSPWYMLTGSPETKPATDQTISGGGGYRSAGPTFVGTSRADAEAILNAAMQSTFGREATKSEKSSFYSKLNAGERKAFKQQTYGKGAGFSADAFKRQFLVDSLRKGLKKDPDDELLGEAGKAQDAIENYAVAMGLTKNMKSINNDVVRVLSGSSVDDILREYKKDAMVLYKPVADRLKEDATGQLTVQDIISPYTKLMADLLDKDSIDMKDGLVQKLLSGDALPSYGEVNKMVRGTAEFAKTTTAKSEAAQLGRAFLSAFRFGG